jgi:hypothetical protein
MAASVAVAIPPSSYAEASTSTTRIDTSSIPAAAWAALFAVTVARF